MYWREFSITSMLSLSKCTAWIQSRENIKGTQLKDMLQNNYFFKNVNIRKYKGRLRNFSRVEEIKETGQVNAWFQILFFYKRCSWDKGCVRFPWLHDRLPEIQGLKQYSFILFHFCRLDVWQGSSWVKLKASAGQCSPLEALGEDLFPCPLQLFEAAHVPWLLLPPPSLSPKW